MQLPKLQLKKYNSKGDLQYVYKPLHNYRYIEDKKLDNKVIVATDAGSSKKAYKYSEFFGCPIAMLDKRRDGNKDKAIGTTIIGDVKGKNAIIFDSVG